MTPLRILPCVGLAKHVAVFFPHELMRSQALSSQVGIAVHRMPLAMPGAESGRDGMKPVHKRKLSAHAQVRELLSRIEERQSERRKYFLEQLLKHADDAQRCGLSISEGTLQAIRNEMKRVR
eukprot:CAMPEP_0183331972 /NCGR_PEP_ID=MMETSP0164_2-20130417/1247_1 /TAXON_ID=221442 /ORGANISM="Coccolithus pelagicus ssp braarudi, Strain PLY182g" /LENGTH=121 /DNA_ID=CAMNT_0025500591 /DNA_START=8 /DNA_END=373 /DNA_ORIENTATION=-